MLITLYGINNIGKSTHAKILVEKLKAEGKKAIYLKYPVYDLSPSGDYINKIIRSAVQEISEEELQTWFVVNRFQNQKFLREYLAEGYFVVAEDYIWTGITWGYVKGADLDWLKAINKPLIKENLAILLFGQRQTSAEEVIHIHENHGTLIERCQEAFLKFASEENWEKVKLQEDMENTADLIWEVVRKRIAN